jgi:hypothetical protein
MAKLPITSVTLGLDVRDMEYGSGNGRFIHLRSDVPTGMQGLELDEAFDQSLDMLTEAWKTIIAARYVDRSIDSETTSKAMKMTMNRLNKIRTFIKEKQYEDK